MSSLPQSPDTPQAVSSPLPYLPAHEAKALLQSGLAIAVELVESSFSSVVKVVRDELSTRWDLDADGQFVRRLLEDRSQQFQRAYVMRLRELQDYTLKQAMKIGLPQNIPYDAESLSLVDATTATSSMLADRTGHRIRGHLEETTRELHLVVGYLVANPQLRASDDPLAPDVFVRALLMAAEDLTLSPEAWNLLLTLFERPFAAELGRVQLALIDHFGRHGADSRLIRRELAARQVAARAPSAAGGGAVGAGTAAATDTVAAAGAPSATGAAGPGLAAAGGIAAAAGGPFTRIDIPQVDPNFVLSQLLARLNASTQVVTLAPGTVLTAGVGGGASSVSKEFAPSSSAAPELLGAVNELQQLGLQGLHGASIANEDTGDTSAWREHLLGKATRTVDKLTIEIVGMMFDHVMQDPLLPAEIKALLSRLQFPVLKAALMDADFFASSSHPARRLIDRIASTSTGWEPYGDENERFRGVVGDIVRDVLTQFDKDVTLFDALLERFEAFLAEMGPRDSDPLARARVALEEAEKREVLVVNTTIQVRRAFEKILIDDYLRDFLTGPWVQVLVSATLRDAQTPGFSRRFREAIHDIVWSVQPKANSDDRKRLTQLIPNLLRVLQDGMALVRMAEHDKREFMQKLMASHAVAIKPVDQATYIRSSLVSSEVKATVDSLTITGTRPITTVAGGIRVPTMAVQLAASEFNAEVNMPEPLTEIAIDRVEDIKLDEEIATWRTGSWFMVWNGREMIKARLRWISPLRTLFLFSANDGKDAHVLPPNVIKSYMKRNYIKQLESMPLLKRAVQHVVGDIEKMPKFAQKILG